MTWDAACVSQGLLGSIGVSNFGVAHLEKLLKTAKVVPAVNQVCCHQNEPASPLFPCPIREVLTSSWACCVRWS